MYHLAATLRCRAPSPEFVRTGSTHAIPVAYLAHLLQMKCRVQTAAQPAATNALHLGMAIYPHHLPGTESAKQQQPRGWYQGCSYSLSTFPTSGSSPPAEDRGRLFADVTSPKQCSSKPIRDVTACHNTSSLGKSHRCSSVLHIASRTFRSRGVAAPTQGSTFNPVLGRPQ